LNNSDKKQLSEIIQKFSSKENEKIMAAASFASAWDLKLLEVVDFLAEQKDGTVEEIMNSLD